MGKANEKGFQIMGIPLPIYLLITALVFVTMMCGWLPKGMIGAFAIMMVFGGLFNAIGNNLPIVRTYPVSYTHLTLPTILLV